MGILKGNLEKQGQGGSIKGNLKHEKGYSGLLNLKGSTSSKGRGEKRREVVGEKDTVFPNSIGSIEEGRLLTCFKAPRSGMKTVNCDGIDKKR